MKKTTRLLVFTIVSLSLTELSSRNVGAITDEEFRALQQQFQQQSQQIQDLQKAREEDQKEIQSLKEKVGQTEQKALETQKKVEETQKTAAAAEAAAKMQPIHPVPSEAMETRNLVITGDAEVQFAKTSGQHGSFLLADFAPIFLFRANDNVLFEAGFDIGLHNNFDQNGNRAAGSSTSVDLSFATIDYLFNDYVTLVAGDMLLPLGTYSERAAGWLNKLPDDPLPRSVLPGSGVGLQLRGSKAVGDSGQMVTYAIYGVNGPSSASTNSTANASDLDLDGNVGDTPNWHGSPSAGGRIGWFYPWKAHSDLELGVSGQSGEWSDSGNRLWSATVVDAALHLSPYFEAKGEYIYTWEETDDRGTVAPRGWWVQAAYKLAGLELELPMIPSTELVARYDTEHDGLGLRLERYTLGTVYYITNTLQFEGAYEFASSSDQSLKDQFILQLSYGF